MFTVSRLLALGWTPPDIQSETGIGLRTIFRWQTNLLKYGSVMKPHIRPLGRRPALTTDDRDALFNTLAEEGWMLQSEMVHWLFEQRGKDVSTSTVGRFLKRLGWNRKAIRRISRTQNQEYREIYKRRMSKWTAEKLVFLDESLFNEMTGWRYRGYAPIGVEGRYSGNVTRGETWSITAVMTLAGYLPCTKVKKGYMTTGEVVSFLQDDLLPAVREHFGGSHVCIVLDNCSAHCDSQIRDVIERAGHSLEYLPPYSPDYNPIELTFSVLKAWIRKWFWRKREACADFGDFLHMAIRESRCDRFAAKQFRHSAGGTYLESADQDQTDRERDRLIERLERYQERRASPSDRGDELAQWLE
jgi:transposase